MSTAVTVPDTLEVLVGEKLDLTVDMTNVMAAGDVLSNPTVTVTTVPSVETAPYAISAPVISGASTIDLTIDCSTLRAKTSYSLQFTATSSGGGTSKTPSAVLTVVVIQ